MQEQQEQSKKELIVLSNEYTKNLSTTLLDKAETIHALNKEKGWWDKPRSIQNIFAMICTELMEGVDEHRNSRPAVYQIVDGNIVEYNKDTWDMSLKPEGHVIEVGDAAIRLLDFIGYTYENSDLTKETYADFFAMNREQGEESGTEIKFSQDPVSDIEMLNDFRQGIKQLYIRKEEDTPQIVGAKIAMGTMCLVNFFDISAAYCKKYGFDLIEAIDIKLEFNKQRPYRHGNKAH